MATPFDPNEATFLNDIRLLAGRYKDRSLCEIASTPNGLLYLQRVICSEPEFLKTVFIGLIERFLNTPDRIAALGRLRPRNGR
jgi:hypothetical protein